jgi:wyosine [tRNA(Phe)-imidazoG37] synthetase (radical SAM superfamily)
VVEEKWRKINRPYKRLNLNHVLMGMLDFAKEFQGELVTETMLIAGINDDNESITRLTSFLSQLQPAKSYLSIPIRPPAENQVLPPDIDRLDQIYRIVSDTIPSTIRLFTREENRFVITGDIVDDLLSTTAVHPLREDALKTMLAQCGSDWHVVEKLLREKKIKKRSYKNQVFYQRNLGD